MNVKLLRKIAKVIQQKPAEFDMENWHCNPNTWEVFGKPTAEAKSCGTTHCIAGWAHLLDGRFPRTYTMDAAKKILGLDCRQSERLFFAENWPGQFSNDAKAAAARIEHFIKTGGAE